MRVQSFFSATVVSLPKRRHEAMMPPPKDSASELVRILAGLLLTRKELNP